MSPMSINLPASLQARVTSGRSLRRGPSPRVALIYDRVNKWGGAERVLLALHDFFPTAPLYTLVYDSASAPWASVFTIRTTFLNAIPFLRTRHEFLSLLAPLAFETFNFDDFDIVISISSEFAKAIITKPQTTHLCYCLTPTRYLWSGHKVYKKYPGLGIFSRLASAFLHKFKKSLQNQDFILSHRPDQYLAISKTVQKRIVKYYQQPSAIIYPGINYPFWSKTTNYELKTKNYYLLVSRLVPYKRVGLAIKAFKQLDRPLLIVGIGSHLPRLRSLASPNITFLGSVSDTKLRDLYQGAKALIFPQAEDFGLTALEAQATGTPVIAYSYGGAAETVIDGKTGVLFPKPSSDSLLAAIKRFEKSPADTSGDLCQKNAKKYSQHLFLNHFSAKVSSLWQQHQKTTMS